MVDCSTCRPIGQIVYPGGKVCPRRVRSPKDAQPAGPVRRVSRARGLAADF
ncbi:MAG: hypothetical protein ACOC9D_00995 [Thermodesulfobacteriota bacterium]